MQLFGKRKKNTLLGIDISTSAVKMVELSNDGKGFRLENFAVVPLPLNAVIEKNIREVSAVGDALTRALAKLGTKKRQAAVAVSGSAVITKVIEMTSDLNEDQLESQIEIEADQYIPYPLDEVALDFSVMGASERNPEQNEILLAACRKEHIEMRVDALEIADIEAEVVDVEAYALQRTVEFMASSIGASDTDVVAVVDIGATVMTLSVFHEGEMKYTREQLFGGRQLSEEIQRRYGLSAEESNLAIRQGGLPEGYEEEILQPYIASVVQNLTRALQFFFSSTAFNDVDHLVLAGGVAVAEGLLEAVKGEVSADVNLASPFGAMSLGSQVDRESVKRDGTALMIACGLAMRGE